MQNIRNDVLLTQAINLGLYQRISHQLLAIINLLINQLILQTFHYLALNKDINEKTKILNETSLDIFNNFIPNKVSKFYYKKPVWMNKDVRPLSWISNSVMGFWFLLNILLILAFFDILASFFKQFFRPTKNLLLIYPQNNDQIWLYKLNLMCE